MKTVGSQFAIRSTAQIIGEARFYRYGSAALVDQGSAEKFRHEKTAQQMIDCFVESGEWKAGQYRTHVVNP